MTEGDLHSLQYRERRCREYAARTQDISERIAHLKIADIYKGQIAALIAQRA